MRLSCASHDQGSGAALTPKRSGLSATIVLNLRAVTPSRAACRSPERCIKVRQAPGLEVSRDHRLTRIPSVNKRLVLELTRSEYLDRRENVGVGQRLARSTHLCAGRWGSPACHESYRERFTTAAALVNELLEDLETSDCACRRATSNRISFSTSSGYEPLSKIGDERAIS